MIKDSQYQEIDGIRSSRINEHVYAFEKYLKPEDKVLVKRLDGIDGFKIHSVFDNAGSGKERGSRDEILIGILRATEWRQHTICVYKSVTGEYRIKKMIPMDKYRSQYAKVRNIVDEYRE